MYSSDTRPSLQPVPVAMSQYNSALVQLGLWIRMTCPRVVPKARSCGPPARQQRLHVAHTDHAPNIFLLDGPYHGLRDLIDANGRDAEEVGYGLAG